MFSQSLEKELNAVIREMDSAKTVSLSVNVNAYSKKGGKQLYATNCLLEKQQKNSYTKLDDMEYISCGAYEIQMDHSEKYMYVRKKQTAKKESIDLDLKSLKKYFEEEDKNSKEPKTVIKLLFEKEDIKTYQVTGGKDLNELLIELDTKNNKIKKIVYNYSDKSETSAKYIVLEYQKFKFNDSDFVFDLKNYFTLNNGVYKVNPKYNAYKLITE